MWSSKVARVIGFMMAMGIVAASPARGDSTSASQEEGLRLYSAGNFAEAIPYFDQVLARHHNNVQVLNARGVCYLRTEQPEKALADFDRINRRSVQAANLWGGFVDLWFAESYGNRGIALLMLGRDQDALESFQQSMSLWNMPQYSPRSVLPQHGPRMVRGRAGAYQGLGQAYHRLGQESAAVESYNAAIAIDPTDPNGFAGRGDVLASQRLFDQAIADFTEAIRLDATHARAFASRGIVFFGLGRDEAALSDLDQAVALDPRFAKAYSYRGAAHARRGQNELALADYDALIKLLPQNAGAYKDRGGVLVRLGRFGDAIKDLDKAIRLEPRQATAYQNRGVAYTGLGHYERAIDDLTEAIRLDPENAGAYSNRGRAHFATGGYDEAIVDLSLAIKLEPRDAITHFNRAEAFARLGMNDRALQDYTDAVQLAPNLAPAYAAIGRIQSQLGRRDEAIRDYDMALRLDPNGVDVFQDRGNARREGGDWLGALADYDRAVAIDPKRADLYVARGWGRICAGAEWADNDARAYLSLRGWHEPLSPYMALLAVLGARGTPREADVRRLLDEALASLNARAWPVPILRYFRGDLSEAALVQAANGLRQQTEVHAFLGLDRLQAGDRTAALTHLTWVREHGSPGSIASDVARAVLRRIEPGH
jgi:tetratricopeptide (TPR) repeat protein